MKANKGNNNIDLQRWATNKIQMRRECFPIKTKKVTLTVMMTFFEPQTGKEKMTELKVCVEEQ
ncbi:hypothetical protein Hamer_G013444, partial [Homarus americanus]